MREFVLGICVLFFWSKKEGTPWWQNLASTRLLVWRFSTWHSRSLCRVFWGDTGHQLAVVPMMARQVLVLRRGISFSFTNMFISVNWANYVVKGVLGGNPQHHIHQTLELGVPSVIVPVCWTHGVRVADLYVIVKAKHIGREGGGFSNWDKLVAVLFLSVVQRIVGSALCRYL